MREPRPLTPAIKPRAKGWLQTVGAIPDDELSRSAEKLGREWREQANED